MSANLISFYLLLTVSGRRIYVYYISVVFFFVIFYLAFNFQVDALCLINCSSTAAGWIEWGYQLMNARNLRSKGMTQGVLDYLMWHHFGRNPEERNLDLVQVINIVLTFLLLLLSLSDHITHHSFLSSGSSKTFSIQ